MTAETFKLGPPPISSIGWLILALIPISALFSALSLAIAAFARSSKEGQYYLMPLLLITLPLMMLPMLPATELDLGTSLIPITGVMLLLRAAIEGQYVEAIRYVIPVTIVTGVCCLFAIRWATSQFNNESVLFRESERWGLKSWVRHLVRDRGETPTFGEAVLCALILLVIVFFARLNAAPPTSWGPIFRGAVITQLALIATPALLMTIMLTRSPKKTLMLKLPTRRLAIPAAFFLALFLHPLVMAMHQGIHGLYPMSDEVIQALKPLEKILTGQPLVMVLIAFALLPAVCEELAFRGFILSGLRQMGRKWPAILLSSIFFGVTHGMLQQSLAACALGMVIGFVAVQTGSLLPAIIFHFTHNALTISSQRLDPEFVVANPLLGWIFQTHESGQIGYQQPYVLLSAAFAVGIFMWLRRLPESTRASHSPEQLADSRTMQVMARS
jgi:sodium transport system permease protein